MLELLSAQRKKLEGLAEELLTGCARIADPVHQARLRQAFHLEGQDRRSEVVLEVLEATIRAARAELGTTSFKLARKHPEVANVLQIWKGCQYMEVLLKRCSSLPQRERLEQVFHGMLLERVMVEK